MRRVTRSAAFLGQAHEHYPPGGSSDGTPSFELFEERILRGVEGLFARAFDEQPEPIEGTAIRMAMTHAVPYFPALTIFAALVIDAAGEHVELIALEVDDDYFNLISNDPED